jgi:hypothetical protein
MLATMRSLVLLALIAVAPRAHADQFRFAWPVPSRVVVTERVHKQGTWATIRYDAQLAAHPGGKLALKLTNFSLVDLAGQIIPDAATRKKLEKAVKAGSMMPTIILSRDGQFETIGDTTAVAQAVIAASDAPPKQRQQLAKLMKSPQVRASMQARASEFWTLWVGMWAGGELQPGRPREMTVETPLPDGTTLEQPMTAAHQGIAGPPGHVRLSFETRLDGRANSDRMKRYIGAFLQQVSVELTQPLPPEAIEDVAMAASGEIVTDPSTLRPAQARSQRKIVLKLKGEPPRTLVQAHEYTFDWAATPR